MPEYTSIYETKEGLLSYTESNNIIKVIDREYIIRKPLSWGTNKVQKDFN